MSQTLPFTAGVLDGDDIGNEEKWRTAQADDDVLQAFPEAELFPIGQHVGVVAEDDPVNVEGDGEVGSVPAADEGSGVADIVKKVFLGASKTGCIGGADASKGVGIAPGNTRKSLSLLAQKGQDFANHLVVLGLHGAILNLDHAEQMGHRMEIFAQATVVAKIVEKMVQREEDPILSQIGDHLRGVAGQVLEGAVLGLSDSIDGDVDRIAEFRNKRRNFFADDKIGQVAHLIQKLPATINGIVVGDGDEVHPSALGSEIDVARARIAIARADEPHVLGASGEIAVAVEIRSKDRRGDCIVGHSCYTQAPIGSGDVLPNLFL